MAEVSLARLNALRATYLLLLIMIPIGTAAHAVWSPGRLGAGDGWAFTACLLAALSLLSSLGLRHPLKMLPLLLFEATWKLIWLARVALPLWLAGQVDEALVSNSIAVGMAVIVLAAIPWRYVLAEYVREAGASWRPVRGTPQ